MATRLTAAEMDLIRKWGEFYQGLETGRIAPTSPAQEHFVLVCRGNAEPSTEHEWAWRKFRVAQTETPQNPSPPEADPKPKAPKASKAAPAPKTAKPAPPNPTYRPLTYVRLKKAPKLTPERIEELRERKRQQGEANRRAGEAIARRNDEAAEDRRRREEFAEAKIRAGLTAESETGSEPTRRKKASPSRRTGKSLPPSAPRIPDYEEGTPRPGWFTDEDWKKLRKRYDGGSR